MNKPCRFPALLALHVTLSMWFACVTSTASACSFDHSAWQRLLETYVDEDGRVAYHDLQQRDTEAFNDYLSQLASAEPDDWSREEQLAFWINAYNAGIISAIFEGQSAESLIGRGKIFKFWKFQVAGKKRSLDEIEHKILRKRFQEPRIHFAIVCASTSCPRLRREAYVSDRLDEQLDDQARGFINDPRRNHIDPESRSIRLSKIFDWFQSDFERDGTLLSFIARYVGEAGTRDWLLHEASGIKIRHLDYDWSLNTQPNKAPRKRSRSALERSEAP